MHENPIEDNALFSIPVAELPVWVPWNSRGSLWQGYRDQGQFHRKRSLVSMVAGHQNCSDCPERSTFAGVPPPNPALPHEPRGNLQDWHCHRVPWARYGLTSAACPTGPHERSTHLQTTASTRSGPRSLTRLTPDRGPKVTWRPPSAYWWKAMLWTPACRPPRPAPMMTSTSQFIHTFQPPKRVSRSNWTSGTLSYHDP